MDVWLPVVGFNGYEVSDQGQVRSLLRATPRILKPGSSGTAQHKGYPMVILAPGRHKRYVHRLVADAFLGPCPDGQEVRHKDGDYSNCAAENLEYGTSHQNHVDAVTHGTWYWSKRTHCSAGHEYTEANTLLLYRKDGTFKQRACRACARRRQADWKERHTQ